MGRRDSHPVYEHGGATVIKKRLSFFSVAAISVSMVLVAVIGSVAVVSLYALDIADRKSGQITQMVGDVFDSLPEIKAALPPVLQDAMNDRREPGYADKIDVKARIVRSDDYRHSHGVVDVTNNGDEVLSLLTLRIVGVDADGEPILEQTICGASPIQIEDEWRGPILPGTTRSIPIRIWSRENPQDLRVEMTDIRVWAGPATNNGLPQNVESASVKALPEKSNSRT